MNNLIRLEVGLNGEPLFVDPAIEIPRIERNLSMMYETRNRLEWELEMKKHEIEANEEALRILRGKV